MLTVTLYMRPGSAECDQARMDLDALQPLFQYQLVVINIETDPILLEKFQVLVPVIDCGPYRLKAPVDRKMMQVALGAASDRQRQLEEVGDAGYKKRLERGHTMSNSDRFSYWFTQHYMMVLNLIVFVYVGLPFLAPYTDESWCYFTSPGHIHCLQSIVSPTGIPLVVFVRRAGSIPAYISRGSGFAYLSASHRR